MASDAYRFRPWIGELGWEVMCWAPHCRKIAAERMLQRPIVTSHAGMAALYDDFADFREHDSGERCLQFSQELYDAPKIHRLYGAQDKPQVRPFDILIHARGISRKPKYNYNHWASVVAGLDGFRVGVIGTMSDQIPHGLEDLRNLNLQPLMDILTNARVVVGVSSGAMHLAAACGTDLVVWGDNTKPFGETLEKRYKETWNPHGVDVEWILAKDFQPSPKDILKRIGYFV